MVNNTERTNVIENRRAEIKAFIVNNSNVWFSLEELSNKYDVGKETIRRDIHKICKSLPGTLITSRGIKGPNGRGGFMFTTTPAVVVDEEPENKFKSPWVNHEGYSDPTAKMALENIDIKLTNRRDLARWDAGAVWDATASAKSHEIVLVLRADTFKSIVLPLFEKAKYKIEGNEEYTRIIKYKSYTYYTDIRCLKAKA